MGNEWTASQERVIIWLWSAMWLDIVLSNVI